VIADSESRETDESDGAGRGWRLLAVVSVAAAFAANVYVAWSARWPSFPYDEVATLQMSRMLAGLDPSYAVGSAGYFPGWSLVIAPLWWLRDDPIAVYRLAIAVGVMIAVATIWPLSAVLRRWRLSGAQAVTAAAIVMALPARALQSDNVLSESLLFLLIVLLVLAATRLWERPTVLRAAVLALAAFAVFFTHLRMLPVLVALVIWLVLFLRRDWRIALVALPLVVAAAYAADELGRWLNELLLGAPPTQGERFWDVLETMRPSLPARTGLGQSWSQLLSSFGVAAFGVVAVVTAVWRDLRRGRFGPAVLVFGAAAALFAGSVLSWATDAWLYLNEWVRLDVWLYGRYVDPVAGLVIASGLALLLRRATTAHFAWAFGIILAVALPVLFWVAPQAPTFGYVTPAHLPGVMPWAPLLPNESWEFPDGPWIVPTLTNENRFWLIATLTVLAVMLAMFLLRRRPRLIASLLLVTAVVATMIANHGSDEFQRSNGAPPAAMLDAIDALDAEIDDFGVALIGDCPAPGRDVYGFRNYFFYYSLPRLVHYEQTAMASEGFDVVVSCSDWQEGRSAGAIEASGTRYGTEALWLVSPEAIEAAKRLGISAE